MLRVCGVHVASHKATMAGSYLRWVQRCLHPCRCLHLSEMAMGEGCSDVGGGQQQRRVSFRSAARATGISRRVLGQEAKANAAAAASCLQVMKQGMKHKRNGLPESTLAAVATFWSEFTQVSPMKKHIVHIKLDSREHAGHFLCCSITEAWREFITRAHKRAHAHAPHTHTHTHAHITTHARRDFDATMHACAWAAMHARRPARRGE